jgi:hypothetical protein
MKGVPTIAIIVSVAVFLAWGCSRAAKRETDVKAVRAEILTIEDQWATAVERQHAAAFDRQRTSSLSMRTVVC